ncbi:MAG: PA14 domain-containing protein [Kiritimatiellia bacterium]
MKNFILGCLCLVLHTSAVWAENILFPADSGVADVTQAPFNADPTGKTDSTAAIQRALSEKHEIIYLPNGTYLVSDTLQWGHRQNRQILQGQSEAGTIIRLPDHATGYGVPSQPKSVIWTGRAPAQRFRNGLRNLTVDTGSGNPGAIGIQYVANNQGAMHHVTIRSGDGAGRIGLDLGYTDEQGPCLIKHVSVKGFDVGISLKHAVNSVTMEHIRLEGQNIVGLSNDGQCLSMRRLSSINAVPAIENMGAALLTLLESDLQGTDAASGRAALVNRAGLFVRDLKTSGYKLAIDQTAGNVVQIPGPVVTEFSSNPVLSLFPSPPRSLHLPVRETPEVEIDDLEDWINIQAFQPVQKEVVREDGRKITVNDWTDAFQQAIDSGKSTVYLPKGTPYVILGEVRVRGNVKRITGLDASNWNKPGGIPGGTIIFEDGTSPVVVFERFDGSYAGLTFVQAGPRTVVLSSVIGNEWMRFEKRAGSGDVFFEDVCLGELTLRGGNFWVRQLNTEGYEFKTKVLNDGGTAWVMGYKTEDDAVLIDSRNGAQTEVLGGFIYSNKDRDPEKVMFNVENASFSATVGESVMRKQPFHPVRETRGGETRLLEPGVAPGRNGGSLLTLFTGYAPEVTTEAAPVENLVATAQGTGQIKLGWSPPKSPVDGLLIEVSEDGAAFQTVNTLLPDVTAYTISSGLKAGTTYRVRVTAFTAKGPAPSAVVQAETRPAAPAGTGTGLRGDYFSDKVFETLKITRIDPTVDFNFKSDPLPEGIEANNLSIRWTGFVQPRFSERYTFSTVRPGTRLYVNGEQVIDSWTRRRWSGSIDLEAGKKYDLKMEMFSNRSDAAASLLWQSFNTPREPVPAEQLYPATDRQPSVSWSNDVTLSEAGGGTVPITITRSGDSARPLLVEYGIAGDAAPGLDYLALPGRITIPAGSDKVTLSLEVLDNSVWQKDRSLVFVASSTPHYNQKGYAPTIRIQDDDGPVASSGTGLRGEYFQDLAWTDLVGTRVDPSVKFRWGKRSPYPGLDLKKGSRKGGYSARWTGLIQPHFSENYRFVLEMGAHSRGQLWVGDTLVIDATNEKNPRSGFIELTAGQQYPIRVEISHKVFYDARIELQWRSSSQYEQPVPQSQLFPPR